MRIESDGRLVLVHGEDVRVFDTAGTLVFESRTATRGSIWPAVRGGVR